LNRLKRLIFIALAFTIVGSFLIGGVTAAVFTSSDENRENEFSSGELIIELDRPDETPYFELTNISPGDGGAQEIKVTNAGSLDMEYSILLHLTGSLAEGPHPLQMTVIDQDGEMVSPNSRRSLSRGEAETLILSWRLPEEAGNCYQNATADLSITVRAGQRTVNLN
jgi:hypothetical protein